ncbi:MAG: alpha/beta hydrolase [Saprospiraceae bacterium]|nr:alpha/beta hydrolase [Saprospiraceae bacterium]
MNIKIGVTNFTWRTIHFNQVFKLFGFFLVVILLILPTHQINAQSRTAIQEEQIIFQSEGIQLSGTIYTPKAYHAAVVLVHGSGQEPRMTEFAQLLANNGIVVLTYDKRGVGESGGVYAGPEVGTNNIDSTNLTLLAADASCAVNKLYEFTDKMPIGLVGCSQAGWIIPIAASKNPLVEFMVLFSCPVIPTLEQLRFQFFTDGRKDFWKNHTEEEARLHVQNAPDRYQFITTDPNDALGTLSIPGLWLFGEQDIQIPVGMCIENLNALKVLGKPFEYALFSTLGHNTAFAENTMPVDIAMQWIKLKTNSRK